MVTAAGLIAAWAVPAAAATSSRGSEPPTRTILAAVAQVPKLPWTSCHDEFQCATARVPLDYRHPGGTKISIAVVRHVATDPAKRIGSLFVFRVFDRVSYALILNTTDAIDIGDWVRQP